MKSCVKSEAKLVGYCKSIMNKPRKGKTIYLENFHNYLKKNNLLFEIEAEIEHLNEEVDDIEPDVDVNEK